MKFNRKIEWNEYFKHWKSLRLVSVLRAYQSGESIQLKLSLKLSIICPVNAAKFVPYFLISKKKEH